MVLLSDLTANIGRVMHERSEYLSRTIQDQDRRTSQYLSQFMPTLSRTMDDKLGIFEHNVQDRLLLLETAVLSAPQKYKDHESSEAKSLTLVSGVSSNSPHEKRILEDLTYKTRKPDILGLVSPTLNCPCPSVEKRGHRMNCRLAFSSTRHKELRGSLRFFNYLIHYKVAITYSRRFCLLNVEVYPNFTMRAICSLDSPTFQLLLDSVRRLGWPREHSTVKPEHIDYELSTCLLSLREAWPADVLLSGTSLLHISCTTKAHH